MEESNPVSLLDFRIPSGYGSRRLATDVCKVSPPGFSSGFRLSGYLLRKNRIRLSRINALAMEILEVAADPWRPTIRPSAGIADLVRVRSRPGVAILRHARAVR